MARLAASLIDFFQIAHERALAAGRGLDDEELYRRPDGTNSIGWNLWHVSRFADLVQFELVTVDERFAARLGPAQQLWEKDERAARWALDPAQLGRYQTGWEMPESVAHALRPPAAELLDYAERANAALREALALLDDTLILTEFTSPLNGAVRTYAALLVFHTAHVNRHLGMMECLRGQLTGRGTATV